MNSNQMVLVQVDHLSKIGLYQVVIKKAAGLEISFLLDEGGINTLVTALRVAQNRKTLI